MKLGKEAAQKYLMTEPEEPARDKAEMKIKEPTDQDASEAKDLNETMSRGKIRIAPLQPSPQTPVVPVRGLDYEFGKS